MCIRDRFLTLRLALLEAHQGESLPFIGDDLLASFDEQRTRFTLDLLSDFGTKHQTILFTPVSYTHLDVYKRQA